MTLTEIRDMLVAVDPDIKHYWSMSGADAYTYWEETRRLPLMADGRHEEGWRFYVHRFTKAEDDPMVAQIFAALDSNDAVSVSHVVSYEADTGYIHHVFECEAV